MQPEAPSRPGRGFLLAIGLIGILLGGLIGAELAVPLQPALSGGPPPVTSGPVVSMRPGTANTQLNFAPSRIAVVIGVNNTVTFENLDRAPHTVTADDQSFDSGNLAAGATWNYTFASPGNYSYHCLYHNWMKGTVVVKQGTAGSILGLVTIPSGTANLNLNFQPKDFLLIIGINNTVKFANLDSAPHTVTADDGSFNSGSIAPGGSWVHTFSSAGTLSYHCSFHSWMKGTITIVAPKS